MKYLISITAILSVISFTLMIFRYLLSAFLALWKAYFTLIGFNLNLILTLLVHGRVLENVRLKVYINSWRIMSILILNSSEYIVLGDILGKHKNKNKSKDRVLYVISFLKTLLIIQAYQVLHFCRLFDVLNVLS